ncbi:MAG: YbaB/EbfC family nucleoid-associated protein [Phycisphaerae bacterium]|nr:YbaB/EbfC family nucleoid-associated protein [Phycisphaerae bacterium]
MFDGLKNIGNLGSLMSRAKEMQDKLKALQEELGAREFTGDSSAGGILATVNGKLELLRLSIDRTRLDMGNTDLLQQLIVSAVAAAQFKAASAMKDEMAKLASDMGVPPGMLPGN